MSKAIILMIFIATLVLVSAASFERFMENLNEKRYFGCGINLMALLTCMVAYVECIFLERGLV